MDLLEPRNQFVQSKFADFDRHADDLKFNSLQQHVGLDGLVQDTPFVDEDLQLTTDAQKTNRVACFSVRNHHRIGEIDIVPRIRV